MTAIALSLAAGCLPPSKQCVDYVACQQAYDATVDTTAYREGGSCWTTPQEAAACTEQCEVALAGLRQLPDLPDECGAAP
ncbi:MAG: hypothetical protein A2138_06870 [Deltaproteobacteria bacterium RBG_16_71_12]|nr:MAG: hypothetical protein A2138_06870 [Deltaproteobacteria bacterium RBG_16_71_12]